MYFINSATLFWSTNYCDGNVSFVSMRKLLIKVRCMNWVTVEDQIDVDQGDHVMLQMQ